MTAGRAGRLPSPPRTDPYPRPVTEHGIAGRPTAAVRADTAARMRGLAVVQLGLLLVAFLVGMAVNLFVQIPQHHPGSQPSEYFSGSATSVTWAFDHGAPLLQLHMTAGVLAGVLAIVLIALALGRRRRGWIIATAVGFVGVVGAGFNGASFLDFHEDVSSMIMATAFAVAVAGYLAGVAFAERPGIR